MDKKVENLRVAYNLLSFISTKNARVLRYRGRFECLLTRLSIHSLICQLCGTAAENARIAREAIRAFSAAFSAEEQIRLWLDRRVKKRLKRPRYRKTQNALVEM